MWSVLSPLRSIWLGHGSDENYSDECWKSTRRFRQDGLVLIKGPFRRYQSQSASTVACRTGYRSTRFPRAGNIFSRGERYCPLLTADNRAGRLCNVSAVIKNVRMVYPTSACMCVRERIQTSGLTTYNIIRRAQLNGYWTKMGMKLRGLLPRIRSFRQGKKNKKERSKRVDS